ncbi:MAG: hypothetical protein ACP5D5_08885 [Acidithiobacillus sp.]|uniref:hypothetical protein n=1 Tax=Acidithiobacillus sp. TaxID=1872118 RepID=UPI003D077C18
MFMDDVVRVALAGGGKDGFLISYPSALASAAKDADEDKEIRPSGPDVTRYAPTATAAAKVIAAILDKAAKDAIKEAPKDSFDRHFKQAAKEV